MRCAGGDTGSGRTVRLGGRYDTAAPLAADPTDQRTRRPGDEVSGGPGPVPDVLAILTAVGADPARLPRRE